MNVGELFVLFGLKTNDKSFNDGLKLLTALKVGASAIHDVVAGVGEKLVEMAFDAAKAGTHILGTAASLGMSTKSIQEWSYVAKQAGSNVEQFTVGISMFERNLREFASGRGSKRFKDAMREVGMTHQDARAALVGPDGVNNAIFKVADAYQKMGNTANRAAINTGLFGARARGMAQDLGKGSAAVKAQIDHLNAMGGIVSEDKLQNLKKFENSIDDVKTSFNGLVMTVVGGLGPQFSKLLNNVTEWIGQNRALITDVLEVAFKAVATGIKILIKTMIMFVNIVKGLKNGEFGAVFIFSLILGIVLALAGAIVTVLIPAIATIGTAIFAAMLPILPYTLILAAIIALVILVHKHWDKVKSSVIGAGATIASVAHKVGNGFLSAGRAILGVFGKIGEIARDVVGSFVRNFLNGINLIIRALNHLPKVNIGEIDIPEWAKHNTVESMINKIGDTQKNTTGPGVPSTMYRGYSGGGGGSPNQGPVSTVNKSVSIAPTTVNIYGVKNASEASQKIGDSIDNQLRHANSALGGE